ncbi:MAG: hypothetical protein JXR37_30025 [Kiritimatiellae bacterium]|nr:hypothetical protein [Kiritimatiellia bacterium]
MRVGILSLAVTLLLLHARASFADEPGPQHTNSVPAPSTAAYEQSEEFLKELDLLRTYDWWWDRDKAAERYARFFARYPLPPKNRDLHYAYAQVAYHYADILGRQGKYEQGLAVLEIDFPGPRHKGIFRMFSAAKARLHLRLAEGKQGEERQAHLDEVHRLVKHMRW